MEFKQAMQTWKRMCKEQSECMGCPAEHECGRVGFAYSDEFKLEATITKWAEEHPEKTIMDDFFEKYPRATRDKTGLPPICARENGCLSKCPNGLDNAVTCNECWRRPLEEVEG